MAKQTFATLVRGQSFYLKDQVFTNGKPVAVTKETKAYLEQHATDEITRPADDGGDPEIEIRQKFKFTEEQSHD